MLRKIVGIRAFLNSGRNGPRPVLRRSHELSRSGGEDVDPLVALQRDDQWVLGQLVETLAGGPLAPPTGDRVDRDEAGGGQLGEKHVGLMHAAMRRLLLVQLHRLKSR